MPIVAGGLRRTPLSGGVLSATSKHVLPSPATAVRNLMEQARFAHLCTTMSRMHHRRAGYPFGSLVDFCNDGRGRPLLALSPLAIHTRNVLADPRCTLVVQLPGWSGLANARVTVFGELEELEGEEAEEAAQALAAKHAPLLPPGTAPSARGGRNILSANYLYFRLSSITDIYFVGGFGTVQWVNVEEYCAAVPDSIVTRTPHSSPEKTLQALNTAFGAQLPRLLRLQSRADAAAASASGAAAAKESGAEEALCVSIDRGGVDVRTRAKGALSMERLRFAAGVESEEGALAAMAALVEAAAKAEHHA